MAAVVVVGSREKRFRLGGVMGAADGCGGVMGCTTAGEPGVEAAGVLADGAPADGDAGAKAWRGAGGLSAAAADWLLRW